MKDRTFSKKFRKDWKKIKNNKNFNEDEFESLVDVLLSGKSLDPKYRDHSLSGDMKDCRECHIKSDLLLIYQINSEELILMRLGSHSDLFK